MPRRALPPRLHLRSARDDRAATWVILDRGREISTGASQDNIGAASAALEAHIGAKLRPADSPSDPAQVLIATVLADYGAVHGPTTRREELIGLAIAKLTDFFGVRAVNAVTPETCTQYVTWRCAQRDARATRSVGRLVKPATARRELVVLGAAITWSWKSRRLDRPIPITLPPQAGARERHLTRGEAAALLAGALGFDTKGKRHRPKVSRHLARFILLGLYTGTRHDAMLKLRWMPSTEGGWVDLAAGVLYRRPDEAVESAKRRPPLPIPPRLAPHLRRWKRFSAAYVVEYAGRPIESQIRRSWVTARKLAGLGPEVTPHILRHTCATWLLQLGEAVYDVAGVLGTTEDVIRRTYGHHAKDHLRKTVAAFSRRPRP